MKAVVAILLEGLRVRR